MKLFATVWAHKMGAALKFIRAQQHKAWLIGEVVKHGGEMRANKRLR